jgi:hypothetical protein
VYMPAAAGSGRKKCLYFPFLWINVRGELLGGVAD